MLVLGHLFNVAAGLFAGAFVFDTAVLHTIGTAAVVYLLMMVAPRCGVVMRDSNYTVD